MAVYKEAEFYELSERAVTVKFGDGIDPKLHARVSQFMQVIDEQPFQGYVEAVPSYTGITFFYNPLKVIKTNNETTIQQQVIAELKERIAQLEYATKNSLEANKIEIPVLYGGEYGPDLQEVAHANGLSTDEVIQLHSERTYLVYMIGFAPGFPFIGGMNERIATPRKSKPREKVPAGSVGIAGHQTGVYPMATPGGWQLIGQTPLKLFDVNRDVPSLLQSGDQVTFKPISKDAFVELKERSEKSHDS
ncbi:5-oxoprolinase subunit PxpB [Geomicrobium sediminis]|uniref:Inhibitor of KinA n=1 Tax=Geomicrobium sediminis TaxID=1347788 RepID=A0ABS2P7S2_9BACL|nr:5-oxoprolinase subunit PxpB [Geomicrobium sediminis]MBM7631337.1 inhibitor of KinA [Geomicrobium sediminis]